MKERTKWVARTAVLTALLLVLQFATKSLGQFVTGSCVNLVLGVAALAGGLWCGVTVALISPVFASLLGIVSMPAMLVPGVAVGNLVFVVLLHLLAARGVMDTKKAIGRFAAAVASAVVKFGALWLVMTKLLIPLAGLPQEKAAVLTATFTWPQLITALIGGCLAAAVSPAIARSMGKKA